jgi:predicted metal-dependent phosphoesterase TrpH
MPALHLKIDLHTHSTCSDGLGRPEDIIESAKGKGLDGLAITDHNTLDGYFSVSDMEGDLLIIPGFEVETEAGHILVLGLEELPSGVEGISYEELIGWVRVRNGLTVIAHPAISRFHMAEWNRSKPDAVEVLNAMYPLQFFVQRGLRLSQRMGLPALGGSDAHDHFTVGDAYSVVDVEKANVEDVLMAIRSGLVSYNGSLSPVKSRFKIGVGYLKSMLF